MSSNTIVTKCFITSIVNGKTDEGDWQAVRLGRSWGAAGTLEGREGVDGERKSHQAPA
jgi:hypothetical protein